MVHREAYPPREATYLHTQGGYLHTQGGIYTERLYTPREAIHTLRYKPGNNTP